jgi:hypothetical protein
VSVNSGLYAPPLPPLTAEQITAIEADLLAMQARYGWHTRKGRRARWLRFVVANGGKGLREFARDAFLRDAGLVHRFNAREAARPTESLPAHQGWRFP